MTDERKLSKTAYLDAVSAYLVAPPGVEERAARERVEQTWLAWSKRENEVFG